MITYLINLIKRFFSWLLQGGSVVVLLICIAFAIFSPANRIEAIVIGVIALVVFGVARRGGQKAKTTCSNCNKHMTGAKYEYFYDLGNAQWYDNGVHSKEWKVVVDVDIYCPHCQSRNNRKITVFTSSLTEGRINDEVESEMRSALSE